MHPNLRPGLLAALASLALGLVTSRSAPAHAEPRSIEGCWQLEVDMPFPMSDKQGIACFERRGSKLVGRLRRDERDAWKAASSVSQTGNRFSFASPFKNGKVTFSGAFESSSRLKGNVRAPQGTRPFSAERTSN